MRLRKALGIRRPLRSLPVAIVSLALAQRLGEEIVAATELAARDVAATALVGSPLTDEARASAHSTDTILHQIGNAADLYLVRWQTE